MSNIEKNNSFDESQYNSVQLEKELPKSEKMEMIESLNIDESLISKIDNSGDKIKIYLTNGEVYVVDREDYSLDDVLTCFKNGEFCIVSDIDMFSDDAVEYGLYGGDQGSLINNYDNYLNNKTILSIINKHYPDGQYTDEDLKLLFSKMNSNGCSYIASVNYVFEATKDLTDEEFYDKFGFDRYTITCNSDGSYVKNYNYNCMFLDFYLYYQKELGFNSIQDIYGDIEINAVDGAISGDYDSSGSQGLYQIAEVQSYLKQKDVNVTYDNVFDFSNIGIAFLNIFSPLNDYFNSESIKNALDDGKTVFISMTNFTMYYPYDQDGNGLLDDVHESSVGSHAMIVTGMTDDGDLIVSSWGGKYIVKPKSSSIYNVIEDFINGDADGDALTSITIFDTSG